MSQPPAEAPVSRDPEAEVYATTKFRYTEPDGRPGTLEDGCLMNVTIEGLKVHYANMFGPVGKQTWYYKGVLMSNTETFQNLQIDPKNDVEIEVRTSRE